MSSTNKTTYYQLSQYVGTDIINPLTDFNGDNEKIDTALHNIAEAAGSSASDITALTGRVTTAEGKITALENQNGNDVLVTTAQTLSGAINELKSVNDTQNSTLSAHTGSIDNLSARVTTAEGDIDDLEEKVLATVMGDGVKTYGEIGVALGAALTSLSIDEIDKTVIRQTTTNDIIDYVFQRKTGSVFEFENVRCSTNSLSVVHFDTSGYVNVATSTTSGTTFTSSGTSPATNGDKFELVRR